MEEAKEAKEDPTRAPPEGKRPLVGIGVIVLNKDRKVLVGKRKKEGLYGFPGGHLELYETWEGCCHRELKEETGLDIPAKAFTLFHVANIVAPEKGYHFTVVDLACKMDPKQKAVGMEPDKCDQWIWVTSKEISDNID